MMTVKELSKLTGISVRTLHYYDEIGLFLPTEKSEAGYRLYDDKALEILQQILFFREFDIPLKDIKAVMENPELEKNEILKMQRNMLIKKKERIEKLIKSIDDILKGDNNMDFTIFNKTELEEMQKSYAKVVEWFGGKDKFMEISQKPISKEVAISYTKRLDSILQKLADKIGCDVDSFEVKEIIGELGFVMKQMTQIKEEKGLMLSHVSYYRNEKIKPKIDEKYGEGASEFFAKAIEEFYKN